MCDDIPVVQFEAVTMKEKRMEELVKLKSSPLIILPHFQPLYVVEWPPPTALLVPPGPPVSVGWRGCLRIQHDSTLGVWWSTEGCARCTDPFTLLPMHSCSRIGWLITCNSRHCANQKWQQIEPVEDQRGEMASGNCCSHPVRPQGGTGVGWGGVLRPIWLFCPRLLVL